MNRLCSLSVTISLFVVPFAGMAQGVDAIERAEIEAHVRFLADDALEGRMTGERGYEIAALYAESQFRRGGLEPAGEDRTYRQTVPFRRYRIDPDSIEAVLERGGERTVLAWKDDFVASGSAVSESVSVEAALALAGHGIVAPELGIDDYAGIDADGKIVLILRGAPEELASEKRAHYSSTRNKLRDAAAQGAVGVLFFRSLEELERRPWERSIRHAGRAGLEWLDAEGAPADVFPQLRVVATLGPEGLRKVLAGTEVPADALLDRIAAGEAPSFPIPGALRYAAQTSHETVAADNVAGLLPGSDPELAGEVVLFTAHLDHVGMDPSGAGEDPVFNGGYDNAMGSAILLEVARAFSTLSEAPPRSVGFLLVTGEERGLLGSDYFARHPTLEGRRIVANVNLDMPLFLFPVREVIAFGAEHSSLDGAVEVAAREEGFSVVPDPFPEEVIFVRSDQYSFVRRGVPAVYLVPGHGSTDPDVDGPARVAAWRKERYHEPSDDLTNPVDWPSVVAFTRLNFRLGQEIAAAGETPRWKEGDFFGEMFGSESPVVGPRSPVGEEGER